MVQSDEQPFSSTISTEELAAKLWQHLKSILEDNLEVFVESAIHKAMSQRTFTVSEQVDSAKQGLKIPSHVNASERVLPDSGAPLARTTSLLQEKLCSRDVTTEPVCERLNFEKDIQHNGSSDSLFDIDETSGNLARIQHEMSTPSQDDIEKLFSSVDVPDEATATRECILPGCVLTGDPADDFSHVLCATPPKSVDAVQRASEHKILFHYSSTRDAHDIAKFLKSRSQAAKTQCYWALFGITSWRAGICGSIYRAAIFIALLSATLLSAYNLVQQPGRVFENLAETAVSISSLLSLATCKPLDSLIGHAGNMMDRYAAHHHFISAWDRQGSLLLVSVMMVWLCKAIAASMYMCVSEETFSWHTLCTTLAGLLQSGSYLAFIHCDCHIMTFLQLMVDEWAGRFRKTLNRTECAESWNIAQATIRQASKCIETSFLAVQASSLITLLCCAGRVLDITAKSGETMQTSLMLALLELPTLMMAFWALVLFAKATVVTEKSMQIPPIVTSLLLQPGSPISVEDQAFVSFLNNGYAGVYFKGNRMNGITLMNYLYLCVGVIYVVVTNSLSMNQQR